MYGDYNKTNRLFTYQRNIQLCKGAYDKSEIYFDIKGCVEQIPVVVSLEKKSLRSEVLLFNDLVNKLLS